MKLFFTVLLAVFILTTSAQTEKINEYKALLETDITDTVRIQTLTRLANLVRRSMPDSAMIYVKQGKVLADKLGYLEGKLACLRVMAGIFLNTGNYPQSMEYFLEYLRISEEHNYQKGIAMASGQLASIYSLEQNEQLAIEYATKSKNIYESLGQTIHLATPLGILGSIYLDINLDSALMYTKQAYEIAIETERTGSQSVSLYNLGEIYATKQEDKVAMEYFRKSLTLGRSINYVRVICASSNGIAKLFRNEHQTDSALFYSRVAMQLALDGDFAERIIDCSEFLSSYYAELNVYDSAYYYQQITMNTKDSVFSQEKVMAVQNLGFMEKIRQQEMEEARALAQKIRKSNIQMLGAGSVIPFFFILLFVISRRKVKPCVTRFMGLLSLLLLFEFISLLLSPLVGDLTNNNPILTLIILVLIAAILVPLHNKLHHWINSKLVRQD